LEKLQSKNVHQSADMVLPDCQSDVSEGESEKLEMPVPYCASSERITMKCTKQKICDAHINDMYRVLENVDIGNGVMLLIQ
jgi:hypothetical protein